MAKTLKIAVAQHSCETSKEENLQKNLTAIAKAKQQGADAVVLQELHSSMYFCQSEDPQHFALAESIPGATTTRLAATAKQFSIVIVASLFERRAAGLYHNTAVVIDKNGDLAGCYRKMHIPDDPGYYEKYYFTPGDLGFIPIDTSIGRLGVLVCWDQWYPEGARIMAMQGAEWLIYPTAIGWDVNDSQAEQQRQLQAWQIMQRSHAIANHLPVIVANRVGYEEHPQQQGQGQLFWGNSFIADQQGVVLCQADSSSEQVCLAEISCEKTEKLRQTWPFFRDRRIDAYEDLTKRWLQS